jgi:hypothetical protein
MSKKRPLVFANPVAVEIVDEEVLVVDDVVLLVVLETEVVVLSVLLVEVLLVVVVTTDFDVDVDAAVVVAVPDTISYKRILILVKVFSCLGYIDSNTDYMTCKSIHQYN